MDIHLVGTSHIASQSLKDIKREFEKFKPDMVGVELDKRRLAALMSGQRPRYTLAAVAKIGVKGFLFAIIGGFFQQKLGRMVGVEPGADMKQAVSLAKEHKVPVVLLDRDILMTLKRLRKVTFKEKMRFLSDLLFGWMKKKKIRINLKRVPSNKLILKLLDQLKERYPSVYTILVDERNQVMTKKLLALAQKYPDKRLLVVVGAGHIEGMRKLLSGYNSQTI